MATVAPPVEKFRLSASPCAAKGYPMTIQFGAFVRPAGKPLPVPAGHALRSSWGRLGIGWAVGDELQPVPVSLEILYFSYLEVHVEPDKYVKAAKLMLESGGQCLPLDKSPVRIIALN